MNAPGSMSPQIFSDPLASLTPLVRAVYERADQAEDGPTKGLCLQLYVEIAKARKALNLTNLPVQLLHEDGRA